MRHVVMFPRLAFQKHKTNPDGSQSIEADGLEEVVLQGHDVPDYVPEWTRRALANAGMIVPVGEVPEPAPVPDLGPAAPTGPVAPRPTDSRADWETYATSPAVGMSENEAQSYPNKLALIDAINAKG